MSTQLQSNHHCQHTNTQFLHVRCPSHQSTNSVKALTANVKYHYPQFLLKFSMFWRSLQVRMVPKMSPNKNLWGLLA